MYHYLVQLFGYDVAVIHEIRLQQKVDFEKAGNDFSSVRLHSETVTCSRNKSGSDCLRERAIG